MDIWFMIFNNWDLIVIGTSGLLIGTSIVKEFIDSKKRA